MLRASQLESVLKRDRGIVLSGIAIIAAMAWAYMVYLAWTMRDMGMGGVAMGMGDMAMSADPMAMSWAGVDFALTYLMWAVMMIAMMVPTAAPMILVFAKINRARREREQPFVSTGVFLCGYVVVWFGFALLATLLQWGFHQATLMTATMGNVTPVLGGVLLLAAGVFQWTPLKYICLKHCRTPMGFIATEWRDGPRGALDMGVKHGAVCLGCCWFFMGLMFVAGVMNLLWMAGIAAYILVEKVVPPGRLGNWVSWAAGIGMVAWGARMLAGVAL